MTYIRLVLLLLIFSFSTHAAELYHIDISAQVAEQMQQLHRSFVLGTLTFDADIPLDEQEFMHLVDWQEGKLITQADILQLIHQLAAQKRFTSLEFQLTKTGKNLFDLHISFLSDWLFERLKLKGILVGKEKYRQYYEMEPGDIFDEEKHLQAVQKIKNAFARQGYLNARVTSSFERDPETKSVTVSLLFERGEIFRIARVSVRLKNTVNEHEWHGLRKKIQQILINRLIGKSYQKGLIDQSTRSLKKMLARKGFADVGITLTEHISRQEEQVDLLFLIELHQKKEFIFFGNHYFTNKQLHDHVLLFGRSASLLPPSMIIQDLQELYHAKGFWQASIEPQEEDDRLFFLIDEGKRALIKKVELKGIEEGDAASLTKQFFGCVLKHKYVDMQMIKRAKEQVLDWYISHGFLDVRILHEDFQRQDASNRYHLIITLDEGQQTMLTQIRIPDYPELEKQIPQRPTQETPVPFDIDDITAQREWLVNHFKENGYERPHVRFDLKREGHTAHIVWVIDLGKPTAYFGKTIIRSTSKLPRCYIFRELDYMPGDPWSQQAVRNSLNNLHALEIFDHIHFTPLDEREGHIKDVVLSLVQDEPFEIRLRAGLGVQQLNKQYFFDGLTYKAGGSFIMKNPFNRADQLRFDADAMRGQRTFAVQYSQPWLLNMPIRTLFRGYSNVYKQPGLVRDLDHLYTFVQQGFLMGLSRKWCYADAAGNIGIEWMATNIKNNPKSCDFLEAKKVAEAILFEPKLIDKKIPYVLFEPTLFFDYLDNKLDPTKGSLSIATIKMMLPIARISIDSYFIKLLLEQSFFVPIRGLVAAFRIRFGHIFHEEFENIMPAERFYLGGANSVRSYDIDLVPPLGVIECDGKKDFLPRGGKSMLNINAELRFPLYKKIGGAVFQDIGALNSSMHRLLHDSQLALGTGFGVRYQTPIGPLRFDVAFKIKRPDPSISRYAWYLSLGHAF